MQAQTFRKVFFVLFFFLYLPFAYHHGFALHKAPLVDLPSFYYAAQTAFLHGQSPYPPHALDWGARTVHRIVWPFLYPPPTLLLFSPFAAMPYKAAQLLLLASSHACILLLLFLLLHILGLSDLLRRPAGSEADAETGDSGFRKEFVALFVLVYLFLFQPLVSTLLSGQIDFYVIVLLCLTWIALKRNAAPALIALPLVLAIVLKTYPLLLLPILLIKGRWRVAAWTLGYLVPFVVVSVLVLPRAVWHDWLSFVVPYGAYSKTPLGLFPVYEVWNQSINGFTSRLFIDPETMLFPSRLAARVVPTALAAGIVGTAIFLSWRLRLARKGREIALRQEAAEGQELDWEFGLFLLTMFLVAPLSWEHHLVFVLPAICVAFRQIFLVGESRRVMFWVAGAAFVLAWPIPVDAAVLDMRTFHLLLSLKMYGVVVLWAYFAIRLWHFGRLDMEDRLLLPRKDVPAPLPAVSVPNAPGSF